MEGYSLLYRCRNCFFNVFQKWYYYGFAWNRSNSAIVETVCPSCQSKIYILEKVPSNYQYLVTLDQSTLHQVSLRVKGTIGKELTVIWGDNTLSYVTFDGTEQYINKDYAVEGQYNMELYVDVTDLQLLRLSKETISSSLPTFSQFVNLTHFQINNASCGGTFPAMGSMPNLEILRCQYNLHTGAFPSMSGLTGLTTILYRYNSFSGTHPAIASCTQLDFLQGQDNNFTGPVPDYSTNSLLTYINFDNNSMSGSLPAVSNLTVLEKINFDNNNLTGTTPDFSNCVVLNRISLAGNSLTGYIASTLALTLVEVDFIGNALSQASVDQILSDINTNLSSRPLSGSIHLEGGTNATPSALGLTYKANIIAHGWTVVTN